MSAPTLLRIPEVAERLSCGLTHVYELITLGELAAVNIGIGRSKTRVREDDLEAYIESRTRRIRSA